MWLRRLADSCTRAPGVYITSRITIILMERTGASQLRSLGAANKMRSSYQLHLDVRILITTLLLLCAVEGK